MDAYKKQRIVELRNEGMTYAAIASEFGLSENTVKSYCRRNVLGTGAEKGKSEGCPQCGAPLAHTPHKKQKRFCSDKCRLAWWANNPEAMNRQAVYSFVCAACRKEFTAYGNAKRKYCSRACSAKRAVAYV